LNPEQLQSIITRIAPEAEFATEGKQFPTVVVAAPFISKLSETLRNEAGFDFLFCQSGLDYPDHMMVVYHLRQTSTGFEFVLKAKISDRQNPEVATVSHIWRTAEFHEREIYDLFGIVFTGHPDLRRIFLTDDWKGYPLRKDYSDPINLIER